MHDLLGALGEQHWQKWIAQDIEEWQSHKSVSHHLSAYGGMGSFNDVGVDDVWLGTLFEDLKSICYYLAHYPINKPDIHALERSMGNIGFELSGWRCLACGYGVVSHRDIEYFVARQVIRRKILTEAEFRHLQGLVTSIVHSHPSDTFLTAEKVVNWASQSGLHLRDKNDWLRPCPNCASNDTAIYRWSFLDNAGYRFIPSSDNLPVRKAL